MFATDVNPGITREDPGKWFSLALTVLMHSLLLLLLVYGVQWQRRPVEPVMVDLVSSLPEPAPKILPPPPPPPQVVKPPPPPPVVKPDIALPTPPKPKPVTKETPPPKPALSKNEQQENERINEQQRRDFALRLEQDRINRDIAAKEAARKNAMQNDLRAEGIRKSQADWTDLISAKVRGKLATAIPPGVTGKPSAEVKIELLPDRTVKENGVHLIRGTGNDVLDQAILRAIINSSPLPPPDNPDAFDPNLHFVFWPLGK